MPRRTQMAENQKATLPPSCSARRGSPTWWLVLLLPAPFIRSCALPPGCAALRSTRRTWASSSERKPTPLSVSRSETAGGSGCPSSRRRHPRSGRSREHSARPPTPQGGGVRTRRAVSSRAASTLTPASERWLKSPRPSRRQRATAAPSEELTQAHSVEPADGGTTPAREDSARALHACQGRVALCWNCDSELAPQRAHRPMTSAGHSSVIECARAPRPVHGGSGRSPRHSPCRAA